ncbi:MAG TPA: zf-HC2 domain-containing protein [Armatimonadaceae bacterium]|nr:zf-HC2 domain-containing protein [Armatimonadaceae bacterium]
MFGLSRCGPIRSHLWEYAEGTLGDAAVRSRVERHLATCAACRALVEGYRPAAAALRDFASFEQAGSPARPPRWEEVRSRLAGSPASPPRRRPTLVPALGVAGAALALGGAVVGIRAVTQPERYSYEAPATPASVEEIGRQRAVDVATAGERQGGPVRMSADPAFLFLPPRGTFPITVQIRNAGPAVEKARLSVTVSRTPGRTYEYDVSLSENSTTKLTVYPSVPAYGAPNDAVDLTLTGPFPRRSALVPTGTYGVHNSGLTVFGYVGDDISALHSRARTKDGTVVNRRDGKAVYGYVKPEEAPGKSVGYEPVDVLVLGKGAERLSHTQWSAIRQWVLSGGSLVMTAGVGPTVVRSSDAAEIAPVDIGTRVWTVYRRDRYPSHAKGALVRLSGILMPAPTNPVEGALAKPDAEVLGGLEQGRRGTVVRRRLGAGTTLYVGIPPVALRDTVDDVAPFWSEVAALAAPTVPANYVRRAAMESAWFRSGNANAASGGDPFRVTMPRVGTVVNIFALYFVLAVPVTFVVLKRLRRMEWAWATGPALAALTAGGVALMTASLYSASLSRRTAGILVGSPTGEARFVGFTEMFFPRAGTFPVTIPGAEAYDYAPFDYGGYSGPNNGLRRDLATHQVGGDLTTRLPASNLSFRRLYHSQTVRLSGGVTGSVQYLPKGGFRCEVRNDSGRPLRSVFVVIPHDTAYHFFRAPMGDLAPGSTLRKDFSSLDVSTAGRTRRGDVPAEEAFVPYYPLVQGFSHASGRRLDAPFLVARMSGREFGPDLGKSVGDDQSVVTLFALPAAEPRTGTSMKGGRP